MQQHGSKYFARGAPLTPIPCPWGQKVKTQLFQNIFRLHIKLNRINHECGNVIANILPADPLLPPTDPGAGVKMSKLTN